MPQATLFGAREEDDSGADADAISSLGDTNYDWDDLEGMGEEHMTQELFWLKQRANGRWRRFMKKPTMRVRRFIKRKMSGKGQGRGVDAD